MKRETNVVFDLKFTGKTNYSKVSMYCYIIMNFVSVYPSVDLDDYFV